MSDKTQWETMESAPKDGSAILVALRDSDIPYPVKFMDGAWAMTWDHYKLNPDGDGPTHWMPLPGAPQ
jgi:hypothetical protein